MKVINYFSVLALAVVLAGCSGHGYEGEYQSKAGSSNEFLNAFAGSAGSMTMTIGSDYVESQGERQKFEEIFVRESGEESYLVFQSGDSEEAWQILDEKTLMKGNGLVNVKLVRVD